MFTHLDSKGQASMVDVGDKLTTHRVAIASSFIQMNSATLNAIKGDALKKGDVLATARIAGIQAAKRCSELIPLCHPLLISRVAIDFEFVERVQRDTKAVQEGAKPEQDNKPCGIRCFATVTLTGQTGVEMEALTAASVTVLTIFDMAKAVDKNMSIDAIRLEYKSGGKSGIFATGQAGMVLAINLSKETGEQKVSTTEAVDFIEGHGIESDAHAGDWHRQISLLDQSSVDQLIAKGLTLKPGDFAENITTSGFSLQTLPVGSRLRLGQALLEITQIGKECHTRCAIYQQAGDCVMPRDGVFAAVIEGGKVRAGDTMYLLQQQKEI
ncbi:MAG: cyclic pyranopterin monophosphate synthase MoaC [Coriobacteriia bacterium]|nr:cyclic pyranopterin monophosphate synthase MoaC [Coriobacteriia bacterium]